jgi:hypothetical protein
MFKARLVIALFALGCAAVAVPAEQAAPLSALARMPVKEVTVFKDGHAFVTHWGKMAVDASGNVLMDYLPTPVFGAFWAFSNEKTAPLTAVVAGQRKVAVERTALTIRELIDGNAGAQVTVTEAPANQQGQPVTYAATIVGVTERSSKELESIAPPGAPEMLPEKGDVVLLKTAEGTKAVSITRILDVTFKGDVKLKATAEEFRNLLTLKLGWTDGKPAKDADVGLMYLQRGLRWIPGYKVVVDGKGTAVAELQATLINELADLEDVTANLVIGAPSFAFKDQIDPMALQQTLANLSQHFQPNASAGQYLSNSMMTQVSSNMNPVAYAIDPGAAARPADLGPELGGSQKAEDLFVFSVKHITLKKGQRMVVSINKVKLPYKDIYTLDIPFTPPPEVYRQFATQQQTEIGRLLARPKVMHKLRLINKGDYPLTTAPALILRDSSVLAQGMMTYTPVGADVDLSITTAVDVAVKKSDKETARAPNAVTWNNQQFARIDLAGTIKLTNYRADAIDLEVTRNVLGNIDGNPDNGGKSEMVNVFEDDDFAPQAQDYPAWWGWYSWPHWWGHFNGVGRVVWKLKLEPGKSVDLNYTWNYYWQ